MTAAQRLERSMYLLQRLHDEPIPEGIATEEQISDWEFKAWKRSLLGECEYTPKLAQPARAG